MNDPRDIFAQRNSTIITLLSIGLSLYRNMPVVIRLLTNRLHIKSNITSQLLYVWLTLREEISGISLAMIVEKCFFCCVKGNFFRSPITLFFIFYRPTSTIYEQDLWKIQSIRYQLSVRLIGITKFFLKHFFIAAFAAFDVFVIQVIQ